MCGMRGSMGPCALGFTLVESRAVRFPVSRPGSGPFRITISSPRVVPRVCDGLVDFPLWRFGVGIRSSLRVHAEQRGVARLQHFAIAEIHMDAAGQAWIEAADGAHDIYAFEIVGTVLFENGRVLHR